MANDSVFTVTEKAALLAALGRMGAISDSLERIADALERDILPRQSPRRRAGSSHKAAFCFNQPDEEGEKMNAECQIQWNRLKKEAAGDFSLEKLECGVTAYLDENPDDGERTARDALRTIREALRCREHEDETVRHKAGKLIKSCRHSFDEVRKNAGHFRKALTEARERRAEAKACPGIIPLGGGLGLEEVLSIGRLMSIGKTLDICVGKRKDAQEYLREVELGESGLWVLFAVEEDEPRALLKTDVKKGVISEFSAHDNDDPEISFELAMEILEKLDVTADDVPSFARAGAFGRFKGGRPEVEPVRVDEQEMWIWFYEDELIVGMEEQADGKLFWSRFTLNRENSKSQLEWDDDFSNHLSLGMFFEIVRRNPRILEKLGSPVFDESPHVKLAA